MSPSILKPYIRYKKDELVAELNDLGLHTTGPRNELYNRLKKALEDDIREKNVKTIQNSVEDFAVTTTSVNFFQKKRRSGQNEKQQQSKKMRGYALSKDEKNEFAKIATIHETTGGKSA